MCVECCWCLCIHKVSFRGASYFFASVHTYEGVSKLLGLVLKNVLLQTYFLDNRKIDIDMPQASGDTTELLSKSFYYLATTICGLLIFRGIEKEWRHLIQWSAIVFSLIESIAFGLYIVLYPEFYESPSSLLSLSSRIVFVLFYLASLFLYSRELSREEAEEIETGGGWEWEPKFLPSIHSGGILGSVGGFNLGLGMMGTLGFGENTSKWLENKEYLQNTLKSHHHHHHLGAVGVDGLGGGGAHYLNDKLEHPRYEVCKSSSKM